MLVRRIVQVNSPAMPVESFSVEWPPSDNMECLTVPQGYCGVQEVEL